MTRSQRLTLIATILGSTIVFLDSTVVNVALPTIQEDLDTGLAGQQWVVEAYMLALVSLLLVGGSLGDLFGRRRMFVVGLVGFAICSMLCAIAPSAETLIGARALQGIAGALLVPGSLAILAATFEGEARGRAVGLWTAWAGISTLIGPVGGGLLVELDWRLIFWVNLPLIALTSGSRCARSPESSDPEAVHGIDWVGIGLSALGLAGPVFALIEQPTYGFSDPIVWAPLAGGIACLVTFVWWESRARAPMLPLELFRSHNFSTVNFATLCVYAALGRGVLLHHPVPAAGRRLHGPPGRRGDHPGDADDVRRSPRASARSPRGSGRGSRWGSGPLIAAVGLGLLTSSTRTRTTRPRCCRRCSLFGLGLSMTVAPLTTTVLDSVAERHVGVASGVNNAVARVAQVLAIAALGAVISAQFSSALDDRVAGQPLSSEASAAVGSAKEQPLSGGDVGDVPDAEASALDDAIVESSESAFHLGMLIATVLMAVGGAISLLGVRNPKHLPERAPAHGPGAAATAGECGRIPTGAPGGPKARPEPSLAPS